MGLIADLQRLRPTWRVTVDGQDVSALFKERRARIELFDATGVKSDRLSIDLVDGGRPYIEKPAPGAEVKLWLGYWPRLVYMGQFVTASFETGGAPDAVRIDATAAPIAESSSGQRSMTEQRSRSWPKGTRFGDLVARVASDHGLRAAVGSALGAVALPHVDQIDESDMNLLSRLGLDLDAVIKWGDGAIVVVERGAAVTAGGQPMPVVSVQPSSVARWRYSSDMRPAAERVVASSWDEDAAEPLEVAWDRTPDAEADPASAAAGAVHRIKGRWPDRPSALRAARAESRRKARAEERLEIECVGDPEAVAGAQLRASGFRPYVDRDWTIQSVRHLLDDGGYRMSLVAEPPSS